MQKRTHVVISDRLLKEIDLMVGVRQRSTFIAEAAERELVRRRQLHALDRLVPWREDEHPELKHGAQKYVRALRRESDQRVKRRRAS